MFDKISLSEPMVTVIIKTLNEERNISRAIQSALVALESVGGEVVVADSCSVDKTIDIARTFPIVTAILKNASERCCGIGPQLGYQHSRGKYIYILDGDMRMHADFLVQAVKFMEDNPRIGGVGGQVIEQNTTSLEFLSRVERGSAHMKSGVVDRLEMGGLYRRTAIESVGYFSDRNLHSYEEFDLALRLARNGWLLHRLPVSAVDHFGHDMSAYSLLMRRWRSRYADGLGELLRAASIGGNLLGVWRGAREARIYLGFLLWTSVAATSAAVMALQQRWGASLLFFAFLLSPWFGMIIRKRSVIKATYSIASWSVNGIATIRGLFAARVDPRKEISSVL
jgi:GT2 family glycosyltransferase